jgi:hypothetical protein
MGIFKTIAFCVLLGICLGCSKNRPVANPDFKMESDVLGMERDSNLKQANEKYQGKMLEVTGRINRIETIDKGKPEMRGIFLTVRRQIRFRFADSDKAEIDKLKTGDIVTVQGVYTVVGNNDMYLDKCVVVSTTK